MASRPAPRLLLGTLACVLLMAACSTAAGDPLTDPSEVVAEELGVINFIVSSSLPGPVTSLTADLSLLPPGNSAVFTTSPDNTSGTFHWSPEVGSAGSYVIPFVTIAGGGSNTVWTTLTIMASGTTALTRGEFSWGDPDLIGANGAFDIPFVSSDQGGTSTLTVPVFAEFRDGCPDAPSLGAGDARKVRLPEGAGLRRDVAASAPTMSLLSDDSYGHSSCGVVFLSCFCFADDPIGLIVEASSTTPEAELSLTCGFYSGSFNVTYSKRDPRLIASTTVHGDITVPLAINVDAVSPDGDPIASLTADLSSLPPENDAVFTESSDHLHGVLTWTPALADSGNYSVEFRASNRFTVAQTTAIHVRGFDITGVPAETAGLTPAFSAVVRTNPLGANSRLQLVTTRPGPVRVQLFDAQGRLIRELMAEGNVGSGEHQIPLGMKDGAGRQLRSGVYFYRVEAAEGVLTGRMAILK
jgi:hypothetical protein